MVQSWVPFCCKMWGTAKCETNIDIGSTQKWSFINADSQSCF